MSARRRSSRSPPSTRSRPRCSARCGPRSSRRSRGRPTSWSRRTWPPRPATASPPWSDRPCAALLLAAGGSIATTFVAGTAHDGRRARQRRRDCRRPAHSSQRPRQQAPNPATRPAPTEPDAAGRVRRAARAAPRPSRGRLLRRDSGWSGACSRSLVVAASFDVLGLGEPGVGWLTAAIGLGGFVGGVVALGLVGSRSLANAFGAGMVAWGGGILLAGVVPNVAVVVAFLALAGIGKVGVDVAGVSLLQRTVPRGAAGPHLRPARGVDRGRPRDRARRSRRSSSRPSARVPRSSSAEPCRSCSSPSAGPSFARRTRRRSFRSRRSSCSAAWRCSGPLQLTTIEQLAVNARRESVAAGEDVVRQGEPGRTFYIVDSGRLEALVDGRPTGELGLAIRSARSRSSGTPTGRRRSAPSSPAPSWSSSASCSSRR